MKVELTQQRRDRLALVRRQLLPRKPAAAPIECRYRIRIAEKTAGRYLRRWGFSPQKPLRRAYEQSEPKVRAWLEEVYPEIEKRARQEGAEILWPDEMGMRSDHTTGTSWSPKGKTPVAPSRHGLRGPPPLTTGYGKLVLAEFNYELEPTPSFPFDTTKERWSMYQLKRYGLPALYWHAMMKGRA